MIFFLGLVFACYSTDPDSLPSVEVLLVPPKEPFPEVQLELLRLRNAREAKEKQFERTLIDVYSKEVRRIDASIQREASAIVSRLMDRSDSFLQTEKQDSPIESVVIHVGKISPIDTKVKQTIQRMESKRSSEEDKQIRQAISEFRQMGNLILRRVKEGFRKHFRRVSQSLLQTGRSNIRDILNIRVGSSSTDDHLSDGASFPSVVSMVEDEHEKRDESELVLLNSILFYTDKLCETAVYSLNSTLSINLPRASFLETPSLVTRQAKSATKFAPPAFKRILRKRALSHSTVELNIEPPVMDDSSIVDQLNGILQTEMILKKSRIGAYIRAKRRLVKEVTKRIDDTIRTAAIKWGQEMDPGNITY